MLRALAAAAVFCLGLLATAPGAIGAGNENVGTCTSVIADLSMARAAGDSEAYPAIFDAAMSEVGGCDELSRHCIGEALALGQLDAAYSAADSSASISDLLSIAQAGLAFGAPWQLEIGLGDLWLEKARGGGGGADYSVAALHFQLGMIAINEPPVCGDFGEAPRPSAEQSAQIYHHLSTALLLAEPLQVASTKCGPCQWLFLSGIGGYEPASRPLPITFETGSSEPTAEGRVGIAELARCLMAQSAKRIVLSGHADTRGSASLNQRLSARRLERVATLLGEAGFDGWVEQEPRGEDDPFLVDEGEFSIDDRLRLSRRIELIVVESDGAVACE